MWATTDAFQQFSPGGGLEGQFAIPGVILLDGLAVDSADDTYVQTEATPAGLVGIHKYSGGLESGLPRDESGQPSAFALGSANDLYVVEGEGAGHRVLEYDPSGIQLASFDAGGEGGAGGIAYSEKLKALYLLNGGSVRIVGPPPPGPLVLAGSESATEIEPTSATLGAMVNSEGKPTEYHFEYGTTVAYGTSSATTELKGGAFEDLPASAAITNLQPSTAYHFRIVIHNASGTIDGPDQSFITVPPVSIDNTSASAINDKSARLEAELNPHGALTKYHFEFDTAPYSEGEPHHGIEVPILEGSAGSGTVDVTRSSLIQSLNPSTTYHYRVVAHNSFGTVEGPDRTFTTQGPAASVLPDGRAWELVSPPNKHGSPLEPITVEGGVIQAASSGGAMTYVALGPLGEAAKGVRSPDDDQWLSVRGADGWATQDITTPREELSIYEVGNPSEYKFFSEDLSAGLLEPKGATPLSPQTTERTPYRREASGEFVPLVTAANVPPGVKFGGGSGVSFESAASDGSHVLLSSSQLLAPGFSPGFESNGALSLYELSAGGLRLISVLPGGEKPAAEAGINSFVAGNKRGAVSTDGARVVFETGGGDIHLYMRDVNVGRTVQLDEVRPGAAGGAGSAIFQAASSDGSRVFFTDESRLTTDATARHEAPDLYMCEVEASPGHLACALRDLTVDPNVGERANVQGQVAAIDTTGDHVYFAANGVLAPGAVPGKCGEESEDALCNLYVRDTTTEQTRLVAVLSGEDAPDWIGHSNKLGTLTARSSPSGRYFTFMSQRSLTGYDNHDLKSGQRDEEVFLFDAVTGRITCASCNPTKARPLGIPSINHVPGRLLVDYPVTWESHWLAGSIPGWTLNSLSTALYQSRYLSNSGRLFFNSSDALVPQDTNGVEDVYQYEPPGIGDCTEASLTFSTAADGCVALISSGSSNEESAFLDASADGDEAFFLTAARLTSSDVDAAFDVYDAHVCSSSAPCPPPPPPPAPACEGDACQTPIAPPNDLTPGSLTYHGPANASPPAAGSAESKRKPPTRAELFTRALKACKKKPKKQRAKCEKQARERYGAKKAAKAGRKTRHPRKASHSHKGRRGR